MSRYILPIVSLLCFLANVSFAQKAQWRKAYNIVDSGRVNLSHSVFDEDGNGYFAGTFSGKIKIDTTRFSSTSTDGIVIKTNKKGEVLFHKVIGGSSIQQTAQVAYDDSGSVFVTGSFFNEIEVDNISYNSSGSYDGFLMKCSSNGKVRYISRATGNSIQQAFAVSVDKNGFAYYMGRYFGSSKLDGTTISGGGGSYDLFLAKVSPNGKYHKVEGMGGQNQETAVAIQTVGTKVFIAGNFQQKMEIGNKDVTASGFGNEIFYAEMDTTLDVQWLKKGGGNSSDAIVGLHVNENGELFMTGNGRGSFSLGGKTLNGSNTGFSFVSRLRSNGNARYITEITAGSSFFNSAYTNAVYGTKEDNLLVVGRFSGTIDIDNNTTDSDGSNDVFIAEFDNSGNYEWLLNGGGTGNENGFSLVLDSNGFFSVGGSFRGSASFGDEDISTNSSFHDGIFLARGIPPVEKPDWQLSKEWVYADSTFSKSFDLGIDAQTSYKLLRGPSGMTFDSSTVTISFTPDTSQLGRHWVTLEASNIAGTDKDSFRIEVITLPRPKIEYDKEGCIGNDFSFFNRSKNSGLVTIEYFFGDGTSSLRSNSVKSYSDTGDYRLVVYATNVFGLKDSVVDTISVFPIPEASFSFDRPCVGDSMTLRNTTTVGKGKIDSIFWFRKGQSLDTGFTTKVFNQEKSSIKYELIAKSDAGCLDTAKQFVRVTPKPQANFSPLNACVGEEALFFDQSVVVDDTLVNWKWNFGDGTVENVNFSGATHQYKTEGEYISKLTVATKNGCKDSATARLQVYAKPTVTFLADDICFGSGIELEDLSTTQRGSMQQRRWLPGDGTSYSKKQVTHFYKKPGEYSIRLISINSLGCSDTADKTILVNANLKPSFSFTGACDNQQLILTDESSFGQRDTLETRFWKDENGNVLGNGNKLSVNKGNANEGVFTLLASTKSGCVDSITDTVNYLYSVQADFGLSPGCQGDTILITTNFDETILDTVHWFGLGIDVISKDGDYYGILDSAKEPQLYLKTLAKNGCEDSLVQKQTIYGLPSASFTYSLDTNASLLNVQADSTGLSSYNWFLNGQFLADGLSDQVSVQDGEFYTVQLRTENSNGCENELSRNIFIDLPASLNGKMRSKWRFYPNPTHNKIYLQGELTAGMRYELVDMQGKILKQGPLYQQSIDLSELHSATYILSIRAANGNIILRELVTKD